MFRVLTGDYAVGNKTPKWVIGKVDTLFDRRVDESWLKDDIVKRELYEVEKVTKIDGLMLTKESGKRIPINWISQGSKQFIMMTRNPKYVVDCYHVGWNVYKFFMEWAITKHVDVTMLMNGNSALYCKELQGVFLNNNRPFNTPRELVDLIYIHEDDHLYKDTSKDGYIICEYSEEASKLLGVTETRIRLY